MLVLLKWIHLLSVLGTFGGLLAIRFGLPASVRNQDAVARGSARLLNILLGVGLLAGLSLYFLKHGMAMGPHYNGVIGLKFVILIAVGGLIPMSKKPGKGDAFRTIAIVLLAIAALAGASI